VQLTDVTVELFWGKKSLSERKSWAMATSLAVLESLLGGLT
jgi:hypothetical protein